MGEALEEGVVKGCDRGKKKSRLASDRVWTVRDSTGKAKDGALATSWVLTSVFQRGEIHARMGEIDAELSRDGGTQTVFTSVCCRRVNSPRSVRMTGTFGAESRARMRCTASSPGAGRSIQGAWARLPQAEFPFNSTQAEWNSPLMHAIKRAMDPTESSIRGRFSIEPSLDRAAKVRRTRVQLHGWLASRSGARASRSQCDVEN